MKRNIKKIVALSLAATLITQPVANLKNIALATESTQTKEYKMPESSMDGILKKANEYRNEILAKVDSKANDPKFKPLIEKLKDEKTLEGIFRKSYELEAKFNDEENNEKAFNNLKAKTVGLKELIHSSEAYKKASDEDKGKMDKAFGLAVSIENVMTTLKSYTSSFELEKVNRNIFLVTRKELEKSDLESKDVFKNADKKLKDKYTELKNLFLSDYNKESSYISAKEELNKAKEALNGISDENLNMKNKLIELIGLIGEVDTNLKAIKTEVQSAIDKNETERFNELYHVLVFEFVSKNYKLADFEDEFKKINQIAEKVMKMNSFKQLPEAKRQKISKLAGDALRLYNDINAAGLNIMDVYTGLRKELLDPNNPKDILELKELKDFIFIDNEIKRVTELKESKAYKALKDDNEKDKAIKNRLENLLRELKAYTLTSSLSEDQIKELELKYKTLAMDIIGELDKTKLKELKTDLGNILESDLYKAFYKGLSDDEKKTINEYNEKIQAKIKDALENKLVTEEKLKEVYELVKKYVDVLGESKLYRISGDDRYKTSVEISKKYYKAEETKYVVLVSGEKYPDALVASTFADSLKAPILLTAKDKIQKSVLKEIERLEPEKVYVIGGKDSISDKALEALKEIKTERIAGDDRYETSTKLAELVKKANKDSQNVIFASGENFADALSSSYLSVTKKAPILLVGKDILPEVTKDFLKEYDKANEFYAVGGVNSISNKVIKKIDKDVKRLSGEDRFETSVKVAMEANKDGKKYLLQMV